jgi:hypothetical protein
MPARRVERSEDPSSNENEREQREESECEVSESESECETESEGLWLSENELETESEASDEEIYFPRALKPFYSKYLKDLQEGQTVLALLEQDRKDEKAEGAETPGQMMVCFQTYKFEPWSETENQNLYPTDDEVELTVEAVKDLNQKYRQCKQRLIDMEYTICARNQFEAERFWRRNALTKAIRKHSNK